MLLLLLHNKIFLRNFFALLLSFGHAPKITVKSSSVSRNCCSFLHHVFSVFLSLSQIMKNLSFITFLTLLFIEFFARYVPIILTLFSWHTACSIGLAFFLLNDTMLRASVIVEYVCVFTCISFSISKMLHEFPFRWKRKANIMCNKNAGQTKAMSFQCEQIKRISK